MFWLNASFVLLLWHKNAFITFDFVWSFCLCDFLFFFGGGGSELLLFLFVFLRWHYFYCHLPHDDYVAVVVAVAGICNLKLNKKRHTLLTSI